MIFSCFFLLKTALAIVALSFVTCTFSPMSLNLHPPLPEMVDVSSFLKPVGHSLRISADLNRRHKPVAEPLLFSISFICEDKSILRRTGSTSVDQIQSQVFLASAVELWSSKVEILSFKLLITLKLSEIHKSLIRSFPTKWIQMNMIF